MRFLSWSGSDFHGRTSRHALCGLSLVVLFTSVTEIGPLDREFLASAGGLLAAFWPVLALSVARSLQRLQSPLWPAFGTAFGLLGVCLLLPENRSAALVHYPGLLSSEECSCIIAAAEEHGSLHGWSTTRHGRLSTEDIPVLKIAAINETLPSVLAARLAHITNLHFSGTLEPQDMFVVRYTEGRQVALRSHFDGGHVTYSVALSKPEEYTGGGVRFPSLSAKDKLEDGSRRLGRVVRPPQGGVLLQPAKVRHEGTQLENGTRYLLISFNKVRYANWQAHFRGHFDLRGLFAWDVSLYEGLAEKLISHPWVSPCRFGYAEH